MTCFFRPNFRAAICLAALALLLAGCGRRGPLEPPPGAAVANPPPAAVQDANKPDLAAENAAGATPAPPRAKAPRPFVLDPLL